MKSLATKLDCRPFIATVLFVVPSVVIFPWWFFVFHHAVNVMQPVHHDHRAGFLSVLFVEGLIVTVVLSWLPAFILFWRSNVFPRVTKWLVLTFVCLTPLAISLIVAIYVFFFPNGAF